MRKTKKIKTKYHEKVVWEKSDQKYMLLAGSELIMKYTTDYFECQDTGFCKEYLNTVKWAMKYIDSFYEKLKLSMDVKKHLFNLAEKKYLAMITNSIRLHKNTIGFNLNNDRESSDYTYYVLISESVKIFEALINTLGLTSETEWMFKYYKVLKIQMRSIAKIFETEIGVNKKC